MSRLKEKLFRKRYIIGFSPFDERIITSGRKFKVRYIKNPLRDRWYADPFLLDVTEDKFIVLVEEFRYENPIGRIARLEVDRRTMKITDEKIVLELDTHLSFPIFLREGKYIFLYPENSASGSLNLYLWIPEQEIFVLQKCLVDTPLTDAVIFSFNGHSFLLSTEVTEDAGSGSTMKIFRSDSPDETFSLFQTIRFPRKIARNAGGVLQIGESLYRVAQDCSESYGRSILIQRICFDATDKLSFEDVSEILPKGLQYGVHTFNVCGDWAVVDANVADYPLIRHLWFGLAKFMKSLS